MHLNRLVSGISHRAKRAFFAPNPVVQKRGDLLRLGSVYGGWTLVPSRDLEGCTIVSAGLGEDASFDIEFAQRFKARVILVDPTPRAIEHYKAIMSRIGQPAQCSYVAGGKQPIEAYALDNLNSDQLDLVQQAIWRESTELKFFLPRDHAHVSHSIVNYQNNYSDATESIVVEAVTIDDILDRFDLKTIPLLKLDIEGAEHVVIRDMLSKGIRPSQLLVEFDELNLPSRRSTSAFEASDQLLRSSGYSLASFDGQANFLYVTV